MHSLPLIHFLSFGIYLYVAIVLLVKNFKSLANRSFAVLSLSFSLWSLGLIFIHDLHTSYAVALFFTRINALGWIGFPICFLWFIFILTEEKRISKKGIIFYLLSILAIVLFYQQWQGRILDVFKIYYGWAHIWQNSFWAFAYFIYLDVALLLGLYKAFIFYKRTDNILKKKQAKVIIIATAITFPIATITNIILPKLNIYAIPQIADLVILFGVLGMAYALVKYKILTISAANAAENIIAAMSDMLILLDPLSRIINVNKSALDLLEYKKEEILDKSFEMIIKDNDYKTTLLNAIFEEDMFKSYDIVFKTKTGKEVSVSLSTSLIKDQLGVVSGIVCIANDISEHKLKEDFTQYTKQRLEREMDEQIAEIKITNEKLMQEINERKLVEETLQDRLQFEALVTLLSTYFVNIAAMEIDSAIYKALQTMGEFIGVDRSYIFLFSEDFTKMSKTYEWCQEGIKSEIKNFQNIPVGDLPWFFERIKKINDIKINKISELPSQAYNEKKYSEHQQVKSFLAVPIVYRGKAVGFIGLHAIVSERTWSEENITLLRMAGEFFINALERKRAEDALASEKERLAVTLRSIGDGVITTDLQGKIILINKVAIELTGCGENEAYGKVFTDIFHIIDAKTRKAYDNPLERFLKSERTIIANSANAILVFKNKIERLINYSISPIRDKTSTIVGMVLVFQDITEQQRLTEELARTQKLESIGVLAGGIAHDFNNILTGILSNISLAKVYIKPENEVFEMLSDAEKASFQAKHLTQQLLTFSKGGAPVKKAALIDEIIRDSSEFILRGAKTKCEYLLPKNIWTVEVDPGQISQVIQNIVINADQAMPSGGKIQITGANVILSDDSAIPLTPGRYVKIAIKDDGIGIPKEYMEKIFDPYFTTKQKGSGLGLATCYSIIKKHEGYLGVDSEIGKGTTFSLYLPVSHNAVAVTEEKLIKPEEGIGFLSAGGKILVMDDDDVLRKIIRRTLITFGYEVELASDGYEAINIYKTAKNNNKPFDVIVLDLTVRGSLGGKETIEKIREFDPKVKAIASSGYSNDPVMVECEKYGFSAVIAKPYKIEELNDILHKLVNKKLAP